MDDAIRVTRVGSATVFNDLRSRYENALREYLSNPVEVTLGSAHAVGHEAHARGLSFTQITAIHHDALRDVLSRAFSEGATPSAETGPRWIPAPQLKASGLAASDGSGSAHTAAQTFFAETVASFEAGTRDAEESCSVLAHQKRQLEHRARRIGSEICESTKQVVALVHLELDKLAPSLPSDAHPALTKISELLDEIDSQLAGFSLELWPAKILEHLGLIPAIEFAARQASGASGIPIRVQSPALLRLTPAISGLLFQAVEEGITNLRLHSGATLGYVRLEQKTATVICKIWDNGVSFEPSETFAARGGRGLGLIGICRDVQSAGGTFTVRSALGHGTELIIELPKAESSTPNNVPV